jgi:hypothetical protein
VCMGISILRAGVIFVAMEAVLLAVVISNLI